MNKAIKLNITKSKATTIVVWKRVFSKPLFLLLIPKESPPPSPELSVFVFWRRMRIISSIDTIAIVINSQFMMSTLYQIHIFLQIFY